MSKRPYDRRDPYEVIKKHSAEFATGKISPKLSEFARAVLHMQMGGTVRCRIGEDICALRLVGGEVTIVDDVKEPA
jgi:hypothetical protein